MCEFWARLARRDTKGFAFDGFTDKATERKLQELEKILPSEIYKLPLHAPPEKLGDVLARCRALATEKSRKQLAREPGIGTMWEAPTGPTEQPEVLPDEQACNAPPRLVPMFSISLTLPLTLSLTLEMSSCTPHHCPRLHRRVRRRRRRQTSFYR